MQSYRREKGFPEINLGIDIIYSYYDAPERDGGDEEGETWLEEFRRRYGSIEGGAEVVVFNSASPVEAAKEKIPLLALDVNENAWKGSGNQKRSSTKKTASSLVRIPLLLLKVIKMGLNSHLDDLTPDNDSDEGPIQDVESKEGSPDKFVNLRDISIAVSTQVLAGTLNDRGGQVMGLGNKVPFTDKTNEEGNAVGELPNLKSQFDSVLKGLNEELERVKKVGNDGMTLSPPRIEAVFDGLREGSNVTINFDLDETDFRSEAEKRVRKRRRRGGTVHPKDIERMTIELIKERIGEILKEHPILRNITQYEEEKATTMDVKGSRKIFLSVEPVKVTKVKQAIFNLKEKSEKAREWFESRKPVLESLLKKGDEEGDEDRKTRFRRAFGKIGNYITSHFPNFIRKKYYRVRISVNFDRYWQDSRQLIRSSEAYRVKKETDYIDVEEIIPEDPTVSRLEERKVLATEMGSVSPFDLAKEYPLYQVNEDPLPAFVQAPFGRMGKVFWQQLVLHGLFPRGVTSQFNNGHPNLRIVGIFVPIGREKDLFASLQKDSIYGPLAGKVELNIYSTRKRGARCLGRGNH